MFADPTKLLTPLISLSLHSPSTLFSSCTLKFTTRSFRVWPATMRSFRAAAAILLLAAPLDASNAKGAAFLQENKDVEGVTTLPSGLQYKVIQAATNMSSPTPSASTPCECHYEGRTIDGKVIYIYSLIRDLGATHL
jgi:hypothetical protein